MGLALALVPIVLFPLLKKYNEVLALGYVVFRGALETALYIGMTVGWLVLIVLSLEYVKAGAPAASYFQTLGTLLLAGNEALNTILIIVFSLNALMLYTVFYQSKLIPRWISLWGFIAILLHLTTAFLLTVQRRRVYDLAGLDGSQSADFRAGNGDGRLVDREGLQFHGHRGSKSR